MSNSWLGGGRGLNLLGQTLSGCLLAAFFVVWTSENVCRSQTLEQALDATNLTWTTSPTGGAQPWSVESQVTHDGVSAAWSGSVNFSSKTSTLQTRVSGPGTLTFWWSNPSLNNRLTLNAGGSAVASLIAYPGWQSQTIYLGPGSQTLQWVYAFSFSDLKRGYLDQVSYTP